MSYWMNGMGGPTSIVSQVFLPAVLTVTATKLFANMGGVIFVLVV
ncbi:Uncharacterised protein [Serratia proteamaculans]|nr:Uncharacterised protein [Serratia proteamaculans]